MTRITATHAGVHIQRIQREPDGPAETIATLSLIGPGMTTDLVLTETALDDVINALSAAHFKCVEANKA
jgi:hypothetical protein